MAMKRHGRIPVEANAPGMTVTLPLQGKSSPFSDGTKIRPTPVAVSLNSEMQPLAASWE
jgi:hypothetical protein